MPLPPPRSRLLVVLAVLALLSAWRLPVYASPPEEEQEVLRLINAERTARGLNPLTLSPCLCLAAQQHADDMAQHNFFSHDGSDGRDFWRRLNDAGYPPALAGEAIAAGIATPAEAVRVFMGSTPHRDLLMRPDIIHLGVGHGHDDSSTYKDYWTLEVAIPGGPCVLPGATATPTPAATRAPTATLAPPATATLPAYVPPTLPPPGPTATPLPRDIQDRMIPRLYLPNIGRAKRP